MKPASPNAVDQRVQELFESHLHGLQKLTDWAFIAVFAGQWLFALVLVFSTSPLTWNGTHSSTHTHVWAAFFIGVLLVSLPIEMIYSRPGQHLTRLIVASSQVLFSALLIHLMGGRIEAHFHVFGSLAILSFYRDATVFIPAVGLVLADHLFRGIFWPDSVFGVPYSDPWRAMEHGGWVLFEVVFLLWGVAQSRSQLWALSSAQVSLLDEKNQLERKVVERVAELEKQQTLLRDLLDSIPCAIYWKDSQLRFIGCNMEFARVHGMQSPSQIIGRKIEDMGFSPQHTEDFKEITRNILRTGLAAMNKELRLDFADGITRTMLISQVPLLDREHRIDGILGVLQDISEQKTLQSQLAQAQKLESIGNLAAGIAHEINTPMQCVCSNVEFLENCSQKIFRMIDGCQKLIASDDQTTAARMESLSTLTKQMRFDYVREQVPAAIHEAAEASQRVIEIVRAMKAMSHPGTLDKVSTNINQIALNAITISKSRWKYVATVDIELHDAMPDVKALPAELSQVFLNLIVNAADAIGEKHGDNSDHLGQITVRTRPEGEGVLIEVIDTGNGIPDEIKSRVFDPFFTTKDIGKGTGQGLAITYDVVVAKHQGRISLESQVGVGTTFAVWLPCQPPEVVGIRPEGVATPSDEVIGTAMPLPSPMTASHLQPFPLLPN